MRIAGQDCCWAYWSCAILRVAGYGFSFDVCDDFQDVLSAGISIQISPAGQRGNRELQMLGEVVERDVFAQLPGTIVAGTIDPNTFEGLAGDQSLNEIDAGPFKGGSD